jgi:tetratricopeptide (TPR) repeat protein
MQEDQSATGALTRQARDAEARRDWPNTALLARQLRERVPGLPTGYQLGAAAARGMKRLDEAASILEGITERFPNEAWPLAELAWTAKARGDRPAVIRLVAELIGRFPDKVGGYQIGFTLAMEMQRYQEASEFAAVARQRFPDKPWPLAFAAMVAHDSGDAAAAARITAELRLRFPDEVAGYEVGAVAARSLQRFDEADALLAAARARFPDATWPLTEQVYTAQGRGDHDAAIAFAAELRRRFPASETGYWLGARFLRKRGLFDEAELVCAAAHRLFPEAAWPNTDSKAIVLQRENRARAEALVETLGETTEAVATAASGAARAGRTVIVVLGMHRSGTSLCARLLRELGVELGAPLAKPGFDNPDGFFEHAEVLRCHQTLLLALGAEWDTSRLVAPIPDAFWTGKIATEGKQRMAQIVTRQLHAGGGVWGFKDPRTLWFLPLWRQVFAELGVRPVWLMTVRAPGAVAASLFVRDGLPVPHGSLIWAEHYLSALRHLGPEIAGILLYERWFEDDARQVDALAALIGGAPAAARAAARRAIKPGFRHQTDALGGIELARTVHGWLSQDRPDLAQLQSAAETLWRSLEALAPA